MTKRTKQTAGEQLRAWRSENGVSQGEAADAVGVTQPAWSEWENDKALPQLASALRVAKYTGLPVEIFLRAKTGTDG